MKNMSKTAQINKRKAATRAYVKRKYGRDFGTASYEEGQAFLRKLCPELADLLEHKNAGTKK